MRSVQQLLLLFVILVVAVQSCSAQTNAVGEALLDDYMNAIPKTAKEASRRRMLAAMDEFDQRAQGVQDKVPKAFLERYRRLLDATRATITDRPDPQSQAKVRDFVKAITGKEPSPNEMIGAMADATLTEIFRLRSLLKS